MKTFIIILLLFCLSISGQDSILNYNLNLPDQINYNINQDVLYINSKLKIKPDFIGNWRVYWVLETSDYVMKNIEIPNNHNRRLNNYNPPLKLTRVAILDTLSKDFSDYDEAENFKNETKKIIKHDPNSKYFNDRIIDVWIKQVYHGN